jgi:DNA-binding HxlR family transcriptional regulator
MSNPDRPSKPLHMRAGCTVLTLLVEPLCAPVLRAHREGPLRLPELSARIAGATETALRRQVYKLRDLGALERYVRAGMPYTVENGLTEAGKGILAVAEVIEVWLVHAPQSPIALGSEPAKGAIGALVGGWGSSILHALAVRPLSLTELDSVIPDVSYPSLERRLSAMRAAGQVKVLTGGGRGKPHTVTPWARQAVAPMVTAGRCERRHMPNVTDSLACMDTEAGLLLAMPLVSLPEQLTGSCLLVVDTGTGDEVAIKRGVTGVYIETEKGRVVSSVTRFEQEPSSWALGNVESWLGAIADGDTDGLRMGGEDPELPLLLAKRLHAALAGV